jgi:hypothetical protein
MRKSMLIAALALVAVAFPTGLRADTLLDLVSPPAQTSTPYMLDFVAGATSTDILFEGYQVPSYEQAEDITLTTGGGSNRLGETWTYAAAPSGAMADQFNDPYGTGTNGLNFGGVTAGSFDQFDQTVSTVVGDTYDLSFLFSEDDTGPSGFVVSASNTGSSIAAPEPGTLSLMLVGLGVLGLVAVMMRKRNGQSLARVV